ncbi:MAG: arabinofuranosidase catalytic domain-containing protein [Bryobacteraceae bacterium]
MEARLTFVLRLTLAVVLISAGLTMATQRGGAPPAPQGPCDIYAAAGTPCVTAHSTTRTLRASYNGPLYQVKRTSDGATLDIRALPGVGVADAAAQDAFCANAICVINLIYDQSGKGNHLYQGPPGPGYPGPAKGAFDAQPIADMAPITIGGHKAYGVYIMPGMGFRNNDAAGLAINDEPQGIYMVVDGTHYDSGCCFNYGNCSTNGRAVGTGTMETTYFGTSSGWGSGDGPGPWIMSDMEAGLFSGYNARKNPVPSIDSWRFVTAVVNGGGGNKWDLRGGNAQSGGLTTFYSGVRPGSRENNRYYPMNRKGAILLGTGGDNGNGSSGTFYEGVMTTGYPTDEAINAVQANIVAARYDVQRLGLSRVTTFTPGSAQEVTTTFTNTTGAPVAGVKLSVSLPKGWTAAASGASTFSAPVAPGASVRATFKVTSPAATGAGWLTGRAEWTDPATRRPQSDTAAQRVRNVLPVKINEVRFSAGANTTDQFIELYNASSSAVDISGWTLINTQSQWAPVKLATIPPGTKLAAGGFYLLGLASSGLAAPAGPGATTINVRSTTGFEPGQKIDIGGEARTVVSVGTAAAAMTTVFIPVSAGPWLTVPAGATNLPVTSAAGFEVGQKIGIDIGGNYEVATVTAVGNAATQTTLAAAAAAGATNIKVAAIANLAVGDTLTLDTGARKEQVRVKNIGSAGANGTGIDLAAPLKLDHRNGVDLSGVGTGISFSPATKHAHRSGDAVQALGSGITLDRPLTRAHEYGVPVVNLAVTMAGYQGPPPPNQRFGGILSPWAGSIALMDASGAVVVDAIVYGSQQSNSSAEGVITSPEIATLEGDQHQGGCIAVVSPSSRGVMSPAVSAARAVNRSTGRFPDGRDADSLCQDFKMQPATTLAAPSAAGADNIKVAAVTDFVAGQTITIDAGADQETAVIATVGTPGATTVGAATATGATVIPVASAAGFSTGQTITIDGGPNRETAVVSHTTGGRGGATIVVTAPLQFAHEAGVQVSGSGITLTRALTRAHASGAQIASDLPTPGAPNQYQKRSN